MSEIDREPRSRSAGARHASYRGFCSCRKALLGSVLELALMNIAPMPDFQHHDDVRRLDPIDDSPVAHTQSPRALQGIAKRLPGLDRMGREPPLYRFFDSLPRGLGETRDVFIHYALEVQEPIDHSQAFV